MKMPMKKIYCLPLLPLMDINLIGIRTYMQAKLKILEFSYFLFQHLDYSLYLVFYKDTDSIYMSLGKDNLDVCALKCKEDSWNKLKRKFFPNDVDCGENCIVQNDELPV